MTAHSRPIAHLALCLLTVALWMGATTVLLYWLALGVAHHLAPWTAP